MSFPSPSPPSSNSSWCHPDESTALLHFKNSFSFGTIPENFYCDNEVQVSIRKTWQNGTDCCTWSGVKCDKVTHKVISLDLHCSWLQGIIYSNSSLFFLTHLRNLDLSYNNLNGSQLLAQFGKLTSLEHLNLSFSMFEGQLPQEFSYLSKLLTLDLSLNFGLVIATSSLQRIAMNLTNLKELVLCYTDMRYAKPYSLMNLSSSLTSLGLSSSGLQGEFPENIFRLPNLLVLDLNGNKNLTGSFPMSNWSSPLRYLRLSYTSFLIDISHLSRNLKSLNELYLRNCKFIGSYPNLVFNLSKTITSLDLSYNNFSGEIPWLSFDLERLSYLKLGANNLIGQLPETYINHSSRISFLYDASHHQILGPVPLNLAYLDLSYNLLNGTIPSWLFSLPSLKHLMLDNNQFTGSIKEFEYNSLVHLDLGNNTLHGPVPSSIFQQVNLEYLRLTRNKLSGVIGLDQFSKLKNVYHLGLSYNDLSLNSNNFINYTLPYDLDVLALSSCNISEFPYALRVSERLRYLDLSYNRIQGNIPKWLWNVGKEKLFYLNLSHNLLTDVGKLPWKGLKLLDLRFNLIQGRLPIPPPSTNIFFISNNQLTGEIPYSICSLTSLRFLDLSYNNLNGSIPLCVGNFSDILSVMNLRMNMLDGMIPTTFAKGNNTLRNINLSGNRLEGPVPRSLLNCRNLEILDLGNNMINDTFPQWLESLPMLQVLVLRCNKFHGSIDTLSVIRFPFPKLRIMDLSNNQLNGVLPRQYFETFSAMLDGHVDKLRYMGQDFYADRYYQDSVSVTIKGFDVELENIQNIFTAIDFSRNNFKGKIPKSIGNLKGLKGLNFSHNKISGQIPWSLRNLTNLEWLDLSWNKLSGKIPVQLTEMTSLEVLNLSQNQLAGAIPRGNQFGTFDNASYIGNPGLYGFPLSKTCENNRAQQPSPSKGDHLEAAEGFDWKFAILLGYGCGLVIGISVGYMLFSEKRLACFIRKVGGERWIELPKARKKKRAHSNTKRRNH